MKRFSVEWSQPASIDLLNIAEFISEDSIDSAIRTFNKIRNKCRTLTQSPERGRIVPELKEYGIYSYRELVISPWRVMYRISDRTVFVHAVIDSRRDIEDILIERFFQ